MQKLLTWETNYEALQSNVKQHIEEIRKRDESLATLHEDLALRGACSP